MRSLLVAPVFWLLLARAALADPAGSVVGVSGDCAVESGGKRTALALGATLQVGDTVDVGADARLKLRMADGSILSVASGTKMTVTAYSVNAAGQRQGATLSMPQGLLHAVVAPVDPPAKFEVDTAVGTAAVRSTDWLIEATATSEEVSVLTGAVAVTSKATGHSILVPPNRGTRVESGRDPSPPHFVSREAFGRLLGRTAERPHGMPRRRPEPGRRPEWHRWHQGGGWRPYYRPHYWSAPYRHRWWPGER